MDAIKFVNEKVRMCNSLASMVQKCNGCPLRAFDGCDLEELVGQGNVEKAVEFVEEWSKENPPETRQSLFIKQYPKVTTYKGLIGIRPCQIEEGYTSRYCTCDSSQCVKCRQEYWLQEVR